MYKNLKWNGQIITNKVILLLYILILVLDIQVNDSDLFHLKIVNISISPWDRSTCYHPSPTMPVSHYIVSCHNLGIFIVLGVLYKCEWSHFVWFGMHEKPVHRK